jgi:hypothetical protein
MRLCCRRPLLALPARAGYAVNMIYNSEILNAL